MSSDFWFLDREHKQCGPVGEEEFVRLVRAGTISPDTQIWSAGMTEWRMAGQVERFAPLFGTSGPPAFPLGGGATGASPTGALSAALPVWGLFGRALLVLIGSVLIIPSPWTGTAFYRWLCERVVLPDGRPLKFTGKPGDIWYVFVLWSLTIWVGQLPSGDGDGELMPMLLWRLPVMFVQLSFILLEWILPVLLLRWVCKNATTEDGSLRLSFEGGFLPYIGWNLLLIVSFITIIGWAWVAKFMMQWICRNVRGTTSFEFTGTGLAILWRTLVVGLLSVLIIPIPWMMQWYTRWMISQVAVVKVDAGATAQ
jgi:hypothetical protein